MPLEVGHEITYLVKTGFTSRVDSVRVARKLPVAGVLGAELKSGLGVSHVAWRNGVLVADATSHGRFDPPLPLVAEDGKPRGWHGEIETLGQRQEANGKLTQKQETLRIGTRNLATTHSVLTVNILGSGGEIVVDSWFQPDVGLVQQEQRTNGRRVLQIQLLSGP